MHFLTKSVAFSPPAAPERLPAPCNAAPPSRRYPFLYSRTLARLEARAPSRTAFHARALSEGSYFPSTDSRHTPSGPIILTLLASTPTRPTITLTGPMNHVPTVNITTWETLTRTPELLPSSPSNPLTTAAAQPSPSLNPNLEPSILPPALLTIISLPHAPLSPSDSSVFHHLPHASSTCDLCYTNWVMLKQLSFCKDKRWARRRQKIAQQWQERGCAFWMFPDEQDRKRWGWGWGGHAVGCPCGQCYADAWMGWVWERGVRGWEEKRVEEVVEERKEVDKKRKKGKEEREEISDEEDKVLRIQDSRKGKEKMVEGDEESTSEATVADIEDYGMEEESTSSESQTSWSEGSRKRRRVGEVPEEGLNNLEEGIKKGRLKVGEEKDWAWAE